ncbi:Kinesin-like protein KIF21A [Yarrowia sp. C11]|nr:Kinesin-like protein KIF21A [Yarrowia sp. E02]KAG5367749.1 Kinesin-like protein KIF21A [Yarrowia sp. C11]
MSLPPRTPLPSGIPLRRGSLRERPQGHIRTLGGQSFSSSSNSQSGIPSPSISPNVSQQKRATPSTQSPLSSFSQPNQVQTVPTSPNHVPNHVSTVPNGLMGPPQLMAPSVSSQGLMAPNHVTTPLSDAAPVLAPPTPQGPPAPVSVHAVIRIKPTVAKSAITEFSTNSITVACAPQKRTFLYDHIFGPQTSQHEIYQHFAKATDQLVAGYNVTIMAYGQSGSGKSYTMGTECADLGSRSNSRMSTRNMSDYDMPDPTNPHPDSEGIVQRASADIFRKLEEKYGELSPGSASTPPIVLVSYVELYNEQFRDLLDPTPKPQPMVREDSAGHVIISGLAHQTVSSLPALLNLLRSGSELRQKGSTALNSESSRSHAIFTITLTQNGASSKFNFVDLAGSERLKNTEAKGDRVKEGIAINGGLAALGKVISQLSQKASPSSNSASLGKHISYRDSKLTRLLQDSLGGKAVTYLLSCITCDDAFVSETLSTLSYTQRARAIQLTPEISQNEEMEFEQMKREMEYWKNKARDLARDLSRDSPSRMSTSRDTPSRMSRDPPESPSRLSSRDSPRMHSRDSPTRFMPDSPTRSSRDRSRDSQMRMSPSRHHRNWSHESLKHSDFDVMSPDTTFSPRDSATDVSRTSPDSRENGFSRLNTTTEMHSAVEDMIKQYDLRILGLEEEVRSHVAQLHEERGRHVTAQERIGELEMLLEQRDDEIRELKAAPRSESRSTIVSEEPQETSPRGQARAPLESRITVLESHLDNSRVQHRRTLDELKRLSSHYDVVSRDLERSRKEVEKEKQLRYDVIAQMKRSSVSESRDEAATGGSSRLRTAASFTSSLFASLPRVTDSGVNGPREHSRDRLVNGDSDPPDTASSASTGSRPSSSELHFH